jgi:DNA-directed RNA polymerase subunit RPC12/RpoP
MSAEKTVGDKTTADKTSRTSPSQMQKKPVARVPAGIQCLRCKHEIESYVFTKFNPLPYGTPSGNVMLECPKCGHLEFLSQNSPLLHRLKANPVAVGDGD